MNDLHLFRLLHAPDADPAELAAPLRDLAQRPLAERAAFLGRVGPLTTHADADLRAAACAALAGAHGYAAFRWLVAALADDAEAVRLAALDALRTSCKEGDPSRWVHALFHPRPELRRAALRPEGFPMPWAVKLYLIGDEACRADVLDELEKHGGSGPVVELLFDLHRTGQIDADRLRRLTRGLSWNGWLMFLKPLLPRTADLSADLDAATAAPTPGDHPPDRLDEILALFWDDGDDFFATLHNAALGESRPFQQWLALRLVRRGPMPPRVAATAAVLWPWLLAAPWLPHRDAALAAFHDASGRCPRFADGRLAPLLSGPLFWRDGVPDLYAMGAFMHSFADEPYQSLMAHVRKGDILRAVESDFDRSVAVLRVPDRTADGRRKLLALLTVDRDTHGPRMLAVLASLVPSDQLDFLNEVDAVGTVNVLRALLAIEAGKPFSDTKVTRLAARLAGRLVGHIPEVLDTWLDRPDAIASSLAPAVLGRFCHEGAADAVIAAVAALDPVKLRGFLDLLPAISGIPYDAETRLALALRPHADAAVSRWARRRLGEGAVSATRIERWPRTGVVAALKSAAAGPNLGACVGLLACHDDPAAVLDLFARFCPEGDPFVHSLDCEMVRLWRGEMGLPSIGHAWLYRWDQHEAWLVKRANASTFAADFDPKGVKSASLRRRLVQAACAVHDGWRWRDVGTWRTTLTEPFGDVLLSLLTTPLADLAVRRLSLWKDHGANAAFQATIDRLNAILGELPADVVKALAGVTDVRGVIVRSSGPAEVKGVAAFGDMGQLVREASSPEDAVAAPAARRLLMMGLQGAEALAGVLDRHPHLTWPLIVLSELLGARAEVKKALTRLARSPRALPRVRFRVAQKLWPSPPLDVLEGLLEALTLPGPTDWLLKADVDWLIANYPGPEREACLALIASPHPAAYGRAVTVLAAEDPPERAALRAFLEAGTDRLRAARVHAAAALESTDRASVWPLLLPEDGYPDLLVGLDADAVEDAARGSLAVGTAAAEEFLMHRLDAGDALAVRGWTEAVRDGAGVDAEGRQRALALALDQARTKGVRAAARDRLRPGASRAHKLRTLATTFAWGVRLGRALTGELFDIEMIAGEDLGYTRFTERKLYISPMPILRGEQDGRDVVRGLILHELGHHVYHKAPESLKVWDRAAREKMHPLLNLVSDEHLERNLRARDESYDASIKSLDAYAFQHAAREIDVNDLLAGLGGRAFEVLTQTELLTARAAGCVRLSAGGLLHRMERSGLSFARFLRALRMGLGNRHGDDKVGRGLALFKGAAFRDATMERMYEIAKELKSIFGDECRLLDCVGQDGTLNGHGDELIILGEGITNDELQSAIQRALEGRGEDETTPPVRTINLGSSLDFPLIELVQPMAFEPRRYAKYARRVSRQAAALRQYLERLGLALVPQRQRVQGRVVDRARLRGLVLHGDPRILIARQTEARTDLFLGVVIDCSGSMAIDQNVEKAKLFAALLAEAARGLRGIDVRLWGFTDRRIFDCGDAYRPAIHDLTANEGNNDAAALYHAAQVGRASRRKAKLLVMISDGAPTECTVEALRNLVRRLTARQGFLCAQVAVRPLEHITFPHHVRLEESNIDASVKRFGAVIMGLVRQALG